MRCLGVLLVAALAARAQEPLPIKSAKLTGKTYTLTGWHKLEKGVHLTLGKGVKVVGQGKGGVLNLEGGGLEIAGAPGEEVVLENVWVNLGWKFNRLKIAHAKISGKGGVSVPHEAQTRGKARLENVAFSGDASIWVTFHEGGMELFNVTAQSTCQIASTGADRNVKLAITGCRFVSKGDPKVIQGGLTLDTVKEAKLVNTQVGGMGAMFKGVSKLTLEGCRFDGRGFLVKQDLKGRMSKTKVSRCDFAMPDIRFQGPARGRERVTLTDCHFLGDAATAAEDIVTKRIKAQGVKVTVKSPREKPNDLAGPTKPR